MAAERRGDSAGLARAFGVGVGKWEGAAAEQPGDLAGVDAVVLGLAAADGLHVQGVADHEGDALLPAQVGQPVPDEHALDADDQVVAEGERALSKGSGWLARFLSKTALPSWSSTQTCMVLACSSIPA
jgi:hypothetical protein